MILYCSGRSLSIGRAFLLKDSPELMEYYPTDEVTVAEDLTNHGSMAGILIPASKDSTGQAVE